MMCSLIIIGIASYGALGHVPRPLNFQLFNLSGHFRAAETLTFRLHVVSYPVKTVRCLLCILRHTSAPRSLHGGITYYYCILFLCHLKLFSRSFFCVPLKPYPGDATELIIYRTRNFSHQTINQKQQQQLALRRCTL